MQHVGLAGLCPYDQQSFGSLCQRGNVFLCHKECFWGHNILVRQNNTGDKIRLIGSVICQNPQLMVRERPKTWSWKSTRIISSFPAVLRSFSTEIHSLGQEQRSGQKSFSLCRPHSLPPLWSGVFCDKLFWWFALQWEHPFCWALYILTLRNNLCTRCPYNLISLCCFFFSFFSRTIWFMVAVLKTVTSLSSLD